VSVIVDRIRFVGTYFKTYYKPCWKYVKRDPGVLPSEFSDIT